MTPPRATLLLAALLAAAALVRSGEDAAPPVSAGDGAYTPDQADRGAQAFRRSCAKCHVPSAFRGTDFTRAWSGRRAYDLFELIRTTMPSDSPGRLSRGQYTDIVAYLFRLNGFPPGARELPEDEDGLKRVVIQAKPTP